MTDNKDDLDGLEEDFADFDGDDFDDAGAEDFADGDEFVEEEWDSYDDSADGAPASGSKKSSMMFNLIIGVVLLGGVGFVGMKFLGGGNSAPVPAYDASMSQNDMGSYPADMAQGDVLTPAPDNNVAMGGAAMTGDFTPPPSDPELDFEIPMPFSNDSSEATENDEAPMGASVAADLDFEAEPLTPLPVMQDDPAVPSENDLLAVKDDVRDVAAQPKLTEAGDRNAVTALDAKLDLLFNRLDKIEGKVDKVQSNSGGATYDDRALKASLAKLEKKVSMLADRIDSKTAGVSSAPVKTKATGSTSTEVPSVSAQNAYVEPQWILTSAQPGRATIKKTGQGDVISVSVGDSVSGLGKILSINMDGGKWVVNATNGQIVQ